jgi:hypothetical protein
MSLRFPISKSGGTSLGDDNCRTYRYFKIEGKGSLRHYTGKLRRVYLVLTLRLFLDS